MKKFLAIFVFSISFLTAKAQWVTIPDANLVNWLITHGYSSCMSGNQMDTTCSNLANLTTVNFTSLHIHDFTGIQYFNSLTHLTCMYSNINTFPALPHSLTYLDLEWDTLSNLPPLPNLLSTFYCQGDYLISLPNLPNSLVDLNCYQNSLSSLPALPNSLNYLYCSNNNLTSLPTLPNSLTRLTCQNNNLTVLPALPASLNWLNCDGNNLLSLPTLPNSITILRCDLNNLTSLPELPDSLYYFWCSNNPALTCLPTLHKVVDFSFYNTAIQCLPNYPLNNTNSNPPLVSVPLCTPFSGCPVAWNIWGNVHDDSLSTCSADSLNPGATLQNVKVQLFKNGNLLQQMYVTGAGQYSFDATIPDTLQAMIDTTGLPIYVECPNSGIRNEILSANDSMHLNENFGMKCWGVDLACNSVYAHFAIHHPLRLININVGDLSAFYNTHCASGVSGIVTTSITGAANYVSPVAGALTPSSVNGNVLTYNIADFGVVNFFSAFNIMAMTDTLAALGSPVCITVYITTAANDINHNNDSLTFCTNVVSSFDPNEKEVFPVGNISAGEWLTYTINFQNTGTDTAYGVIVRDTLSNNLDEATFNYLASSNNCITHVKGMEVIFTFPHINLVDSFTNEPLSHGWVQFKIKANDNFSSGNTITNRAGIYFDNNAPVLTNSVSNGATGIHLIKNTVLKFNLFPNPTADVLNISFTQKGNYTIRIIDCLGREIYSAQVFTSNIQLPTTNFAAGIYFVEVKNESGTSMKKFVKE